MACYRTGANLYVTQVLPNDSIVALNTAGAAYGPYYGTRAFSTGLLRYQNPILPNELIEEAGVYSETLTTIIQSISTVSDFQGFVESVQSNIASLSSVTDVQAFIELVTTSAISAVSAFI